MKSTENFVTTAAAAERWGVSQITVLDWIRKKRLRGVRLGGTYRLRPEDIDEFEREGITK